MSQVRTFLRTNRGRAYAVLPLMPVEEVLHRAVERRATAEKTQREDLVVARLAATFETTPTADVVTVMATRNRPAFAARAVQSALDQDIDDHLVVVVNDGGTRPTLPDDPRVLQVDLFESLSCVGSTRNVGIRITNSRLVAILDDDNTWTPTHLSSTLPAFAAGAGLAYTGVHWWGDDGSDLGILNRPWVRSNLAHSNYVDANSIVARRDPEVLFSRMPRKKLSFTAEDWEFVWRLSKRRKVVHVPEISVNYLRNRTSTLSQHDDWLPTARGK